MSDTVWKALADPTRREMLDLLFEQPKTTGSLCDRFPHLDRCTVMKHLEALVAAKLVTVEREGRCRWNYLNPVPLQQIVERWLTPKTSASAARLLALKRRIESDKGEQG